MGSFPLSYASSRLFSAAAFSSACFFSSAWRFAIRSASDRPSVGATIFVFRGELAAASTSGAAAAGGAGGGAGGAAGGGGALAGSFSQPIEIPVPIATTNITVSAARIEVLPRKKLPATRAVLTRLSLDASLLAVMRFAGAVWCVVALAFSVAGSTASAASPAPPSEGQLADAKQHYAAASKFYDLAEYDAALREFKEAYRAVEDPAFLFNIAQCHRKLGHAQDAITFYKNYLRRAPHAANKAEVERRIAELERAPASSAPPAAEPAAAAAPLVLEVPAPAPAQKRPADATLVAPAASAPPAASETPFYKRGWFWIATGAVVASTATTLIVLSTRSDSAPFCPECASTAVIAP